MQTMQGNHRWKEGILTVILLSMLLCTACGKAMNVERILICGFFNSDRRLALLKY